MLKEALKSNADTKKQSAIGSSAKAGKNLTTVPESDAAGMFNSDSSESEFDGF